MKAALLPNLLAGPVLAGLLTAGALAQTTAEPAAEGPQPESLQLLKAPETPEELWDAVRFFLNVGKPDQAAEYLDRLLASKIPAELLLKIRERDGTRYFPKLQSWPQLRQKGAELVRRADAAARARATDPQRIRKFIGYLTRSPQHRAYGLAQLRRAGAEAVPYLLTALQSPEYAPHRSRIVQAMQELDRSAAPPLVAALASEDSGLLTDLVAVLGYVGDRDSVPHLRYVAEARQYPHTVQALARQAVERILGVQYADLPSATDALVEQARRYYNHRVNLRPVGSSGMVRLWRWVAREGLRSQQVSASYAELYYGLMHCRQALALRPECRQAQVLMLSLALEKAMERSGPDQPLPDDAADVWAQALAAGPQLMGQVLSAALEQGRPAVALAAVRALARTGDRNLLVTRSGRLAPLVQALTFPDRRIQFAAAEAVLEQRPQKPFPGSTLIVPVLTRALDRSAEPKALVIDPVSTRGSALAAVLTQAGYRTDFVPDVRSGFRLLARSSAYDLVFVDPGVYRPSISFAIASLRADPRTAGVPIILPGSREMELKLRRFERQYRRVHYFLRPASLQMLQMQLGPVLSAWQWKPLTAEERQQFAARAALWLARIARGEVPAIDTRPAEEALLNTLRDPALGPDAIEAAGRLPSQQAQTALADLAADPSAQMPLRLAAAAHLSHSLRRFGLVAPPGRMAAVTEAFEQSKEPALRQALAAAVGATKPPSAEIGQRLRSLAPGPYQPPPKQEAAPTKPAGKPPAARAPAAKPTAVQQGAPPAAKPTTKPAQPTAKPAQKP